MHYYVHSLVVVNDSCIFREFAFHFELLSNQLHHKKGLKSSYILAIAFFFLNWYFIFLREQNKEGNTPHTFWVIIVFLTYIFMIELYFEFTGSSSVTMRGIYTQSWRVNQKNTKSFAKLCYLTSYYHYIQETSFSNNFKQLEIENR